jgi:hypothetical protein
MNDNQGASAKRVAMLRAAIDDGVGELDAGLGEELRMEAGLDA